MSDVPDVVIENIRVVDDGQVSDLGWIRVKESRIDARGLGPAPEHGIAVTDGAGGYLCPGFVDIHAHGGGGASGEGGEAEITRMSQFHRKRGTTGLVVSLATAPWDVLLDRLRSVASTHRRDKRVLGSHLEGPFLDSAHRGAHDAELLLRPTLTLVRQVLDAAEGTLRQVTLAPEHAGEGIIEAFLDAGVRVAVGHTSATMDQAAAAFDRGASILTHAFNGMPGIHHRAPGPVIAALQASATIEVIADGVHVDPAVIALVFALAPGRIALVTDAIAAAGAEDGEYLLGNRVVTVREGIARLGDHGSLAGSTLTMDRALRVCVEAGVPLADAVQAATRTPARAIGEPGGGPLRPGAPADLVLMDLDLQVQAVWSRGIPV